MPDLTTPYATLSFPVLFSPRPRSEGGEPCYSCSLLFSPDAQKSAPYKAMVKAVGALITEKFPKVNRAALSLPFRDAAEKEGQYEGYNDGWSYISPWTKSGRPSIVDRDMNEVLTPDDVWAGLLVRASVRPFSWVNSGKRGISFGLNHLQIVRTDVPRIDGRISASKAFSRIEDDEMEDMPF